MANCTGALFDLQFGLLITFYPGIRVNLLTDNSRMTVSNSIQ